MPWWCDKHNQHSTDDVCSGCTRETYLKDFDGFKAGLFYAQHMEEFKTEREAYDHWKEKREFVGKLRGTHDT